MGSPHIRCDVCTLANEFPPIAATGILAFGLVPKSPYHTGNLFGGLIRVRGWFSEREADVFTARIIYKDSSKNHASSMKIEWKDMYVLVFR